jgi:hypothetical protein
VYADSVNDPANSLLCGRVTGYGVSSSQLAITRSERGIAALRSNVPAIRPPAPIARTALRISEALHGGALAIQELLQGNYEQPRSPDTHGQPATTTGDAWNHICSLGTEHFCTRPRVLS